jgi:hypothetical protein
VTDNEFDVGHYSVSRENRKPSNPPRQSRISSVVFILCMIGAVYVGMDHKTPTTKVAR